MSKRAFFSIEFQGGRETILEVEKLRKELVGVANDIKNAKKAGDSKLYDGLILQQADLKKNMQDVRKELRNQQTTFDKAKFPSSSIQGLELRYSKLREQVRGLSADQRASSFGRSLIKEANQVKTEILKIDGSIKDFKSNIGNYKSAFSGLGNMLTGGLLAGGAAAAVLALTKPLIALNSEIDGIQSNVRKTTNLTVDEVESLTNRLKDMDTATTLQDLLNISIEAGRFGIEGENAVFKFTQAVNILNIALGDEFQGGIQEVTNEMSKLSNVLFGVTTDGDKMASNFLYIGNALNELANSGAASAGEITNVATRISGMGTSIGLTQGDILGISTSIIEMGINAERGSTAFVKLNKQMRADLDKFAKTVGITSDELKTLLDTKPVDAMNLVINKLVDKSGGSATNLVQLMGELGIRGAGISEIFFKWAQNQELVNSRIELGNVAIKETNSLLAEQEAMMDNIPSQWQRFKNALSDTFVSSGLQNVIKNFLKDTNDALAAMNQFFKGNVTFKQAIEASSGDRATREERLRIASGQSIRDAKAGRGNRTYYDDQGRPFKLTANGREYIPEKIKGDPDGGTSDIKDLTRNLLKDIKKGDGGIAADAGSIAALEKAYNDLQRKIQAEGDPKMLTALIDKSIEAKKQLDEAKKALEILENTRATLNRVTPGSLTSIATLDGPATLEQQKIKENAILKKYGEKALKDAVETSESKSKAAIEEAEKRKELERELAIAAVDLAQSVADSIYALQEQKRQQELESKLAALDKEAESRLKNAQGNAVLEEAIKKDVEEKKLAIQKEYFEKDKKAKIAQAIINAALAIIQAFAQLGPIAGAIAAVGVGITTSFQIASIKNQKFRKGGFTGSGAGRPDETGKKIAGYVHENEYVGSEEQVRRYPKLFDWLENDRLKHLRGYADGGFTNPPMIVRPDYSPGSAATFTDDQVTLIASVLGSRVYEAAKAGTSSGSRQGTFEGNMEQLRVKERLGNQQNEI